MFAHPCLGKLIQKNPVIICLSIPCSQYTTQKHIAALTAQRVNRIWNGRRGTFKIWKADNILHNDLVASAFVFDPNYFDNSVTEVTDYQLVDRSSIDGRVNEIPLATASVPFKEPIQCST
jgi:hypothetical protein